MYRCIICDYFGPISQFSTKRDMCRECDKEVQAVRYEYEAQDMAKAKENGIHPWSHIEHKYLTMKKQGVEKKLEDHPLDKVS